jgi:hypothetical protein
MVVIGQDNYGFIVEEFEDFNTQIAMIASPTQPFSLYIAYRTRFCI